MRIHSFRPAHIKLGSILYAWYSAGPCAWLCCWATLFSTAAADAQSVRSVNINSTPEGALVYLDAQDKLLGPTPIKGARVAAGPHTLIFRLQGYQEFKLKVNVTKAKETFSATLVQTMAINLKAADDQAQGATVKIDGEPVGVLPYSGNVLPGRHMIQVSKEGYKDITEWLDTGKGTTLSFKLEGNKGPVGTVRIVSNVEDTLVRIDGEPSGKVPVAEEVKPGEHLIEGSAEGYVPVQQTITIEAGQQRIVTLNLEKSAPKPGTITVRSLVKNAMVNIDGHDYGPAPVVVENAAPGLHNVLVRVAGYEDFRTSCTLSAATPCNIEASPQPLMARIRVKANVKPAELYMDGNWVGPVPFEGQVPSGSHRLEVRAKDFPSHVEQVDLVPGAEPREFSVTLTRDEVAGLTPEEQAELKKERAKEITGATSHSATPIPIKHSLLDLSTGWPYLAELRMSTGMVSTPDFGVDGGVAIRTYGRLTEFEARAKIAREILPEFSLGAQARLGGGLGISHQGRATNSWFGSIEALGTLRFAGRGAYTMWLGLDGHSDRWDFSGTDSDIIVTDERQNLARLRLGGALEFVLTNEWNLWGMLEGILAGGSRRIYGDILGSGSADSQIYFRLGVTRKF